MLKWIVKKINYVIGYIQGMCMAISLAMRNPRMTCEELYYEAFHEGLINANDVQYLLNKTHRMRS